MDPSFVLRSHIAAERVKQHSNTNSVSPPCFSGLWCFCGCKLSDVPLLRKLPELSSGFCHVKRLINRPYFILYLSRYSDMNLILRFLIHSTSNLKLFHRVKLSIVTSLSRQGSVTAVYRRGEIREHFPLHRLILTMRVLMEMNTKKDLSVKWG